MHDPVRPAPASTALLAAILSALLLVALPAKAAGFHHFITADHGMLKDGDKAFRFISFNVPNLNYIEDDLRFRQLNRYRLPTEFEMRDVFASINQIGGRVVRIYTVPVKSASYPPEAPTYVLGPGRFNEKAFRRLDLMMALANQYGVRIIFPLVNNWPWMGGRPQYAAFRHKPEDAFWTDRRLIADFKATIRHLLLRRNTISGVRYKDDKAILCWETGNELSAPFSWTVQITRYIKSLDRRHLVMDGSRADTTNNNPSVQAGALTERSIDIVTTHHYEYAPDIVAHIESNIAAIRRQKVYVIGEFGFATTAANASILDTVIAHQEIAGALVWSLRFHNNDGGFYCHSEGDTPYKSFLWPGFAAGVDYDDQGMVQMVRRKAFAIQGLTPPPLSPPAAPVLLAITSQGAISWRGSAGASGYNLERATSAQGPWQDIAYNVSDADAAYYPLFSDETAAIGGIYFYRVVARNSAGASPSSNVVGPVAISNGVRVDTMVNLGHTLTSNAVAHVSGHDGDFREIRNRLAGDKGSDLTYLVPGRFRGFDLHAFEHGAASLLRFIGSTDNATWHDLVPTVQNVTPKDAAPDAWQSKIYHLGEDGSVRFIKILFDGPVQLARAEMAYTDE